MVCKGIRKEYECRSNEGRGLGVHVGVWGCGSVGCDSVREWQCGGGGVAV